MCQPCCLKTHCVRPSCNCWDKEAHRTDTTPALPGLRILRVLPQWSIVCQAGIHSEQPLNASGMVRTPTVLTAS